MNVDRRSLSRTCATRHPERYAAKDLAPNQREAGCFGTPGHGALRTIVTLLLVGLLAGCQMDGSSQRADFPTTQSELEISRDPMILATRKADWAGMSLYGIRFGQPDSVIPKAQIREIINAGWIVTRNNNRYRSGNDNTLDGLGVWERELLDRLDIHSQGDIERVFGSAESIVKVSPSITVHYYEQMHVRVLWNELEKRVSGVNVVK